MGTVGRLITAVHTVIIPVTDPDARDAALGDGALELVGGAGHLRAIPLILAVPAVVLPIATEDARNAAVGVGALELAGQADVNVAIGLVTIVLAVIVPITDEGRVGADAGGALELAWAALELGTVWRLV